MISELTEYWFDGVDDDGWDEPFDALDEELLAAKEGEFSEKLLYQEPGTSM